MGITEFFSKWRDLIFEDSRVAKGTGTARLPEPTVIVPVDPEYAGFRNVQVLDSLRYQTIHGSPQAGIAASAALNHHQFDIAAAATEVSRHQSDLARAEAFRRAHDESMRVQLQYDKAKEGRKKLWNGKSRKLNRYDLIRN